MNMLTLARAEQAPNQQAEMVNKYITQLMTAQAIPGAAVILYVDGKPTTYYFGLANKEKQIPVTKDTIFEVGSLTKLMTNLLLAQQVDAAKTQLDQPINEYLPQLPPAFEDLTLGQLATHTTGLPLNWPNMTGTPEQLKEYYSQWHTSYAPDEKWQYSNVGVGLLGDALQELTHVSMEQLYTKKIATPLGMTKFAFTIPQKFKKYLAQGYNNAGESVLTPSGYYPAANALKISVRDMQRFLGAAIGVPGTPPGIYYPMRLTQAAYVRLPNCIQGLGWQIHNLQESDMHDLLKTNTASADPVDVESLLPMPRYNADALIDKIGSAPGFKAYIAVVPKKQAGIVILMNKNIDRSMLVPIAREILFKSAGMIKIDDKTENESYEFTETL